VSRKQQRGRRSVPMEIVIGSIYIQLDHQLKTSLLQLTTLVLKGSR
jgi:hypothetical protein